MNGHYKNGLQKSSALLRDSKTHLELNLMFSILLLPLLAILNKNAIMADGTVSHIHNPRFLNQN